MIVRETNGFEVCFMIFSLVLVLRLPLMEAQTTAYVWVNELTCNQIDITGWTSNCNLSPSTYSCFGENFYGNFWGSCSIVKNFLNLPSHRQLRINFTLFIIDAWINNAISVDFGSTTVYERTFNYMTDAGSVQSCGDSLVPDLEVVQTSGIFLHSATTPQELQITTDLSVPQAQASWGICNLTIEIICDSGTFFYINQCISVCPNGTYPYVPTGCAPCDSSCATCTGPQSTDCASCNGSLYLYSNQTSTTTVSQTCLSTCPNGTWGREYDNTCQNCTTPCANCFGGLNTQCSACLTSIYLDATTCRQTCPNGKWPNNSTYTCNDCVSPCSSCSGGSNYQCTSCISGYFLKETNCVTVCGDGYWEDLYKGTCESCIFSCQTCSNDTDCDSCKPLYYMTPDSQCVVECSPDIYVTDPLNYVCNLIPDYTVRNLILLTVCLGIGLPCLIIIGIFCLRRFRPMRSKAKEDDEKFRDMLFPRSKVENKTGIQKEGNTVLSVTILEGAQSIKEINEIHSFHGKMKKLQSQIRDEVKKTHKRKIEGTEIDISHWKFDEPGSKQNLDSIASLNNSKIVGIGEDTPTSSADTLTDRGFLKQIKIQRRQKDLTPKQFISNPVQSPKISALIDNSTPKSINLEDFDGKWESSNDPSPANARNSHPRNRLSILPFVVENDIIEEVPESPEKPKQSKYRRDSRIKLERSSLNNLEIIEKAPRISSINKLNPTLIQTMSLNSLNFEHNGNALKNPASTRNIANASLATLGRRENTDASIEFKAVPQDVSLEQEVAIQNLNKNTLTESVSQTIQEMPPFKRRASLSLKTAQPINKMTIHSLNNLEDPTEEKTVDFKRPAVIRKKYKQRSHIFDFDS